MIRPVPLALIGVISVALATPSMAQDPVRASIRASFDQFENDLRGADVTPFINRDIETALNAGASQEEYLDLVAGRNYGIRGVCDGDCSDLDLVLQDAQGRIVGSDTLADAQPGITVEQAAGGRYRLTIQMISCSIEPCLVGVRAYHLE